ncbi:MAG: phage protein [Desulfovibrio sp.]
MQRLSGKNFSITVGDMLLHVDKATLTIEDGSAVAKDNGVPNGYLDGEMGASGELEFNPQSLSILTETAKSAKSWQRIPEMDILFYAKVGSGDELKVEAFGCKMKIDSLLDIDKAGGNKMVHKVKFDVTSPDFVHINDVPYLDPESVEGLV